MKSDREFLNGVYKKAKEFEYIKESEHSHTPKQSAKSLIPIKNNPSKNYLTYLSMAASLLLLISAGIYINHVNSNNTIPVEPAPSNFRMFVYKDQLMEQSTDIIAVTTNSLHNTVDLTITKTYKDSGKDTNIQNLLDAKLLGLTTNQTAIIFLNVDSKETPVLDVFIQESDGINYANPYGELLSEEELN